MARPTPHLDRAAALVDELATYAELPDDDLSVHDARMLLANAV